MRHFFTLLLSALFASNALGQDCNNNGIPDWLDVEPSFDFRVPRTHFAGALPQRQTSADFNNDGRPDFATALALNEAVGVLINQGGRLGAVVQYPMAGRALDVEVGLFDGDAQLDLAVSVNDPNQIEILLGDGAGGFTATPSRTVALTGRPRALVAANFDTDGDTDLAVAILPDRLSFIRNNAGVSLSVIGTIINVGRTIGEMEAGELTGDTFIDVVVVYDTGSQSEIVVYENEGMANLTFSSLPPVTLPRGVSSITLANVDNDADLDVLAVNTTARTVTVLGNNGSGVLTSVQTLPTAPTPGPVAAGDIDGDDYADLIVSNRNSTAPLDVFLNDGGGAFAAAAPLIAPSLALDADLVDVDGDLDLDLALASARTAGIAVFENDGAGGFPVELNAVTLTGGLFSVAAADLDGDTDADVAVTNISTETVTVLRNTGGVLSLIDNYAVAANPNLFCVANLDDDDRPDIATASEATGAVSILLNNGDATYAPAVHVPVSTRLRGVAAGNFDDDADLELAVTHGGESDPNTTGTAFVLDNDGFGGFSVVDSFPTGKGATGIVAVDLNNDLRDDLVVTNNGADDISVHMNVAGAFPTQTRVTVDPLPFGVAAGDFDGDGFADLAVTHIDLLQFLQYVVVLINDQAGGFLPPARYLANGGAITALAADMDLDGDTDIVALTGITGDILILSNFGAGTFFRAGTWFCGENPFGAAVADIDGNDTPDLIVSDSLGQRVSALRNTTVAPLSADANGNGVPDECECPGDLNGDGAVSIEDLATLLSNFGTLQGATYEQGDLDGDGDVDISDLATILSVFGTICG